MVVPRSLVNQQFRAFREALQKRLREQKSICNTLLTLPQFPVLLSNHRVSMGLFSGCLGRNQAKAMNNQRTWYFTWDQRKGKVLKCAEARGHVSNPITCTSAHTVHTISTNLHGALGHGSVL